MNVLRMKLLRKEGASEKNFPLLLQAFAKFSGRHPDYRLRIFGEGELREELTALARELEIAEKVELPGRSTTLLEKMNSAAMFVLSSDYEGMPNALIEAMCLGLPVISTAVSGATDLIQNGENGSFGILFFKVFNTLPISAT